jgi:hypothetical protein
LARFSKDFGLIYRFCLLKSPHLALEVDQHLIGFLDCSFFYLSCRHIWLNILVADCHFWCNMRKLKNKKKKPLIGGHNFICEKKTLKKRIWQTLYSMHREIIITSTKSISTK